MRIGFIMLRHVNSEVTNKYWIHCYDCIRTFYPENIIVIIDDNSKQEYITEKELYKTAIVKSEYPGRGELLPYYYYAQYKWFDYAVILHDSVFINYPIHFNVKKYKLLWEFEHHWDQIEDETNMVNQFNDPDLMAFYENKSLWKGCFGCMSVITHDYLAEVNQSYPLSKLLPLVTTRFNRCSFERVIACLLQKNEGKETLLGNIHEYCPWGIHFDQKNLFSHLPLIKVWTGR